MVPNTLATDFKPWLPLRGKTSPAPGEDVTAGDKRGNLARERLRGRGLPGSIPSVIACGDATFPKGTAFGGGGKVSGIAIRRPLGGAGCERSEQTEGVLGQRARPLSHLR